MTSTLLDITYGKARAKAMKGSVYRAFARSWTNFVRKRVTMWAMVAP